jgi:hypothetical protein
LSCLLQINIDRIVLVDILRSMNPDSPQHIRRNPVVFGPFSSATSTFVTCAAAIVSLAASATAAVITQASADSTGVNQSSLVQGARWSNLAAPSAGNDYTSAFLIRTPTAGSTGGTSATFAGDSLTLNNGGSLSFRGNNTTVITINAFTLNGTGLIENSVNSTQQTLAGNLTLSSRLTGGFRHAASSGGITVASTISGAGTLVVTNTTNATYSGVTLTQVNNTYSGGTSVSANGFLIVAADGALGGGNVTVTNAKLTLGGGTLHNYIGNSATLTFSAGLAASAINLNFSGTDTLAAISLDGGSNYLGVGTYSASALNTLYGSSAFTGAGNLQVVPEPGSAALLGLGLLLVTALVRRQRRE